MNVTRTDLAIGGLALAETLGAYQNLLPPIHDARTKMHEPGYVDHQREAYVRAALMSGIIAGAAYLLTDSPFAPAGWLIGNAVALLNYETMLPREHHLLYQLTRGC
jgi:hypothetical protein